MFRLLPMDESGLEVWVVFGSYRGRHGAVGYLDVRCGGSYLGPSTLSPK